MKDILLISSILLFLVGCSSMQPQSCSERSKHKMKDETDKESIVSLSKNQPIFTRNHLINVTSSDARYKTIILN